MVKTFSHQVDIYLAAVSTRKRRPVKQTSLATIRSLINVATPVLGNMNLEDIRSGALKNLAAILVEEEYSPNTIQSVLTTVKMIVASDVDADGDPKHPRKWNNEHIDAPVVESKEVILPTREQIEDALAVLKSPVCEFFATQLATGCRKGELLALKVGDFDANVGLLRVSRTLSRHGETSVKTKAGNREVDIAPEITAMLVAMLDGRKYGRLFDVTLDGVRWAYGKLGIKSHSLRHFRYTRLQAFKIHPAIHNFWAGHSMRGMAAVYGHVHEDVELRQCLVREVGLGFTPPAVKVLHHEAPKRQDEATQVTA